HRRDLNQTRSAAAGNARGRELTHFICHATNRVRGRPAPRGPHPAAPAVKREAEEDWGTGRWRGRPRGWPAGRRTRLIDFYDMRIAAGIGSASSCRLGVATP